MKGGFNCYGCHTKSVNIRQRFRRRQNSLLCRNCDIFVIVVAAVYRCAVKLQSVQGRESVLSVQGRRGRLAKRKRREGEKERERQRESNMARERENERE